MFHELLVTMYPCYYDGSDFNKSEQAVLEEFKRIFGEKIAKTNEREFARREYYFYSKDTDLEEILYYLKSLKDKIGLTLFMTPKTEKEDFDKAVAYILFFSKEFRDYDDDILDDNEEENELYPYETTCDKCYSRNYYRDKIYVKPTSSMKKDFERKLTGASSFDYSKLSIVSDKLYEHLVRKGVDKKYFRDVYRRNKERWAKCLDGTHNILPADAVKCSIYNEVSICPKCGVKRYRIDEDRVSKSEIWAELENIEGILAHGEYPELKIWTIDAEIANTLPFMSLTADYFYNYRNLIVNKELFNMIKEKVPSVTKRSIPIFARE